MNVYPFLAAAFLAAACGPRAVDAVCKAGQPQETAPLPRHPTAGYFAAAHAHNDYEHQRPLEDALAAGFYSVEADVYFTEGRFEVSHHGFNAKGTLKDLYLDPLAARVQARASVYGDGVPFTLWVDLKDDHASLVPKLEELLRPYAMLTRNDAQVFDPNSVSVVLTGNAAAKERFAGAAEVRPAFRDSNDFAPDDPAADPFWRYYALNWGSYIGWNGEGTLPADAARRLDCVIGGANANGRAVRFYGAPDVPNVWRALLDHGAHFVGTDKLEALAAFLVTYSPPQ